MFNIILYILLLLIMLINGFHLSTLKNYLYFQVEINIEFNCVILYCRRKLIAFTNKYF